MITHILHRSIRPSWQSTVFVSRIQQHRCRSRAPALSSPERSGSAWILRQEPGVYEGSGAWNEAICSLFRSKIVVDKEKPVLRSRLTISFSELITCGILSRSSSDTAAQQLHERERRYLDLAGFGDQHKPSEKTKRGGDREQPRVPTEPVSRLSGLYIPARRR